MFHERNRLTKLSKQKQATTGTLIYGGTDSETCNSTLTKVGGYRIVPSIGHLGADAHRGVYYACYSERKTKIEIVTIHRPDHAIPSGGLYSIEVWGIVSLD